jgi:hypothetical protein
MQDAARTYLEQLAAELSSRGWRTKPLVNGRLRVTNPDAADLAELIGCHAPDGRWEFCWSWGDAIGPVDTVAAVADRITKVLRTVDAGEPVILP